MICGHKMSQFYLVWVEVVVRGSQRSLPEKVIIELMFKEMVGVESITQLDWRWGWEWSGDHSRQSVGRSQTSYAKGRRAQLKNLPEHLERKV